MKTFKYGYVELGYYMPTFLIKRIVEGEDCRCAVFGWKKYRSMVKGVCEEFQFGYKSITVCTRCGHDRYLHNSGAFYKFSINLIVLQAAIKFQT